MKTDKTKQGVNNKKWCSRNAFKWENRKLEICFEHLSLKVIKISLICSPCLMKIKIITRVLFITLLFLLFYFKYDLKR